MTARAPRHIARMLSIGQAISAGDWENPMGNWEFRLNEQGTWYWHRVEPANEAVLERSGQDFSTLYLCVRDAERRGYRVKTAGMHY